MAASPIPSRIPLIASIPTWDPVPHTHPHPALGDRAAGRVVLSAGPGVLLQPQLHPFLEVCVPL